MGNYSQKWTPDSCQQYGACNLKGRMKYKRLCIGKNNMALEEQYCKGINVYYEECRSTSCLSKMEICSHDISNSRNWKKLCHYVNTSIWKIFCSACWITLSTVCYLQLWSMYKFIYIISMLPNTKDWSKWEKCQKTWLDDDNVVKQNFFLTNLYQIR